MFTPWQNLVELEQQRRQDLAREFEHRRLVRQALAGRPSEAHFYNRALRWLGGQLIAWGQDLQARYSPAVEGGPLPVAQESQICC